MLQITSQTASLHTGIDPIERHPFGKELLSGRVFVQNGRHIRNRGIIFRENTIIQMLQEIIEEDPYRSRPAVRKGH